jgi:Zn-dependent protease with chaperone function
MSQPNPLELAKQGHPKAIESLINRQMQPKGITAKVALKNNCLHIMLEAAQPPDQKALVPVIRKGITNLGVPSIEILKIYGKQAGEQVPAWSQEFEIVSQIASTSIPDNLSLATSSKDVNSNNEPTQTKKPSKTINADDYRVLGEKEILYGSLAFLGILFFVSLKISPIIAIVIVAISAFWIKVRQSQLIGSGVKVSEHQLPEVYQAAKIASERLSMKMPDVFVVQSPIINAYATGFLDDRKTVVLHSALVEAMNNDEIISILGHEFSHIKCHHTNWLVLTNSTENVAKIPIISEIIGFVFKLWSRKGEYTCDHGGLIACRNLQASISALVKVAVGKELFSKINLDVLLAQKEEIDTSDFSKISEAFETHPYLINRIHELKKFSESEAYKQLTT